MSAKEKSDETGGVQAGEIKIGPELADEAPRPLHVTKFHTRLMQVLKAASGF
jgi:hypothetical protein